MVLGKLSIICLPLQVLSYSFAHLSGQIGVAWIRGVKEVDYLLLRYVEFVGCGRAGVVMW